MSIRRRRNDDHGLAERAEEAEHPIERGMGEEKDEHEAPMHVESEPAAETPAHRAASVRSGVSRGSRSDSSVTPRIVSGEVSCIPLKPNCDP